MRELSRWRVMMVERPRETSGVLYSFWNRRQNFSCNERRLHLWEILHSTPLLFIFITLPWFMISQSITLRSLAYTSPFGRFFSHVWWSNGYCHESRFSIHYPNRESRKRRSYIAIASWLYQMKSDLLIFVSSLFFLVRFCSNQNLDNFVVYYQLIRCFSRIPFL